MQAETGHRFRNWAGTQTSRPALYLRPTSEDEVVELVRAARVARAHLRVVGAGHSWSDIVCTDERLVSLDQLRRLVSVDRLRRRITVEAGMRLRELNEVAAAHGLALSNLGSIAEQSVAGAIATGTHGSGARFGNLSTQVVGLRLVDGTGAVHELPDQGGDDDRFAAARLSLGALGIVTQVTLQCEPAFRLAETSFSLPLPEAVAQLDALVDGADHVKLWWLPHTGVVQVFSASRTEAALAPRGRWASWLDRSLLVRGLFAALLRLGALLPRRIPAINRLVRRVYFAERSRIDRSDRVLNIPMPPRHREIEFAIPRPRAGEALQRLARLIGEDAAPRLHVNFVVELRFVAADDLLLSPAHGRDVCQIGAYMYPAASLDPYFAGFEQLMLEFDGRPHWGKEFAIADAALARRCPGLARFNEVRAALDPDALFENDFVRRALGRLPPRRA